jgi:GNAT superfamily N-acetyltransferase
LYWCWLPAELRLIDIALLPPFQRQGLGSQLVLYLQQLAAAQSLPMSLHVAINNPAIALYQRLGFSVCGGDGMHHQMLWRAAPTSSDENKDDTTTEIG